MASSSTAEVRYVGEIANTAQAIEKLVKQLRKGDADLKFCYEAGPCGYGIHRQLMNLGWQRQVVVPSLIPKKAGDRVKTQDRPTRQSDVGTTAPCTGQGSWRSYGCPMAHRKRYAT